VGKPMCPVLIVIVALPVATSYSPTFTDSLREPVSPQQQTHRQGQPPGQERGSDDFDSAGRERLLQQSLPSDAHGSKQDRQTDRQHAVLEHPAPGKCPFLFFWLVQPGLSGRYRTRSRSPILNGRKRLFSYSPWYSLPSTE